MNTKEIAKLTGRLHKNVLADARKMFMSLYGKHPDKHPYELTHREVFIMFAGTVGLGVVDEIIPDPEVYENAAISIGHRIIAHKVQLKKLDVRMENLDVKREAILADEFLSKDEKDVKFRNEVQFKGITLNEEIEEIEKEIKRLKGLKKFCQR